VPNAWRHSPALQFDRRVALIGAVALVCATVVLGAASPARGEEGPDCPSATDDAYTMTLGALTGTDETDVAIHLSAAAGCAAARTVKSIQVKTFDENGGLGHVVNLTAVAAPNGVATVKLDRVPRGLRIKVHALLQTGAPSRTYVLDDSTRSRLRPDLIVASITTPAQTLTTRPVDVVAEISEVKGDTSATADVTLASAIGPLAAPLQVDVPAGGHASVTFPQVALSAPIAQELKVIVSGAAPAEYDVTNEVRTTSVDVTRNELASSRLLVPSLGGYGFQFNGHLYAPITTAPPASLPDLESKVKALEPQFVRVFYNENWEANADKTHPEWPQNLESFKDTVQLAADSGATVAIAYQTIASAKTAPALWMSRFADVLQELVVTRGLANVRWVSIANEPNSTTLTLAQYEALYRALNAELVARGLRGQIGLIGGDLVELTEGTPSSHRAWFDYMVSHMNDVIDAWSEHIYWNYDDHFRMEERLKDVAHLVDQELPAAARKPTFIMEYGVRGYNTCGTKPQVTAAYYRDADCTELRRMSLAGFQKLWFTIDSAQLGFEGASNWDLYWSVYDRTKANQSYWTIGPPEEGWALYPSYYASQLLFQTTAPGWQVLGVDPWTVDDQATRYDDPHPDQAEQELTAYRGPQGELTVLGLDSNGGNLVAPNGATSSYSIGGLPPTTTFTLALWNASGDGTNSVAGTITTTAAGVARFDVPLQAAFVLTTVPVS
jgi:hypothetical protein